MFLLHTEFLFFFYQDGFQYVMISPQKVSFKLGTKNKITKVKEGRKPGQHEQINVLDVGRRSQCLLPFPWENGISQSLSSTA